MYHLLTKLYSQLFWGKVDVCELYYWPARVFSRASRRCSSLNLSVGSLTWLTYAPWDVLSRWHCSCRVSTLQCAYHFFDWALQLIYVHNQFLIVISSSSMLAMLGMAAGSSKLWKQLRCYMMAFTVSCGCIAAPLIIARPVGVSLLTNNYKTSIKPI